jgi:hypothetical protein
VLLPRCYRARAVRGLRCVSLHAAQISRRRIKFTNEQELEDALPEFER